MIYIWRYKIDRCIKKPLSAYSPILEIMTTLRNGSMLQQQQNRIHQSYPHPRQHIPVFPVVPHIHPSYPPRHIPLSAAVPHIQATNQKRRQLETLETGKFFNFQLN